MAEAKTLRIEGADNIIIRGKLRNFSGRPDDYNPKGAPRSFGIAIDDMDLYEQLKHDGWNVKVLKSNAEDKPDQPWLKVMINFDSQRPPKVLLQVKDFDGNVVSKVALHEDTIGQLDNAEIKDCVMEINPWLNRNGVYTGYLSKLKVSIEQDEFDADYDTDAAMDEKPFD